MESVLHGVFWCPRCGTLRRLWTFEGINDTPELVARCREYETALMHPPRNGFYSGEWFRMGIAEPVNVPDRRPHP